MSRMPFRNMVSNPEGARVLNDALNDVCRTAGIKADSPEYHDAIGFIMRLYWRGNRSPDALRAAIVESIGKEWGV